jgi:Calcineurin-like phosphoesterase.
MKIGLISDAHLEFHADLGVSFVESLDFSKLDVLVLAGDIGSFKHLHLRTMLDLFTRRCKKVIFVPGNHEFYGSSVESGLAELAAIEKLLPAVTVLKTGHVYEQDGVRFLGDTMWFPSTEDEEAYRGDINDFNKIKNIVPWVHNHNTEFRVWLKKALRPGDVVVTHHLPSYKCVAKQYAGSGLNRFFVSEMQDIITEWSPALWLYGHTHSPDDRKIGDTRAVCNPFGYPSESMRQAYYEPLVLDV